VQKLAETVFDRAIDEAPGRVEALMSAKYQELRLAHADAIGEFERLPELTLSARSAGLARRGAHDAHGLSPQGRSSRGARRPVERILQNAGNAVIVFRRCDEERVGCVNRRFEASDGKGVSGSFDIGIVERNVRK